MKACAKHFIRAAVLRLAAAGLALFAMSVSANAQETIGAFTLFPDVPEAIALTGEITETSPTDFRRALSERPNASMLILASKGGNVSAAITIADAVNLRGMTTSIPEGFSCQGACAIVLFAGKVRLVEGELGVNQMPGASPTEITTAMTALSNYGVHRDAFMKVFGTPPETIYVFTRQQLADLGIITTATNDNGGNNNPKNGNGPVEPTVPVNPPEEVEPEPPEYPRLATYEGIDFYGADVRPFRNASSPIACQRLCEANGDCVAFTFNREDRFADKVNCFLKYAYDTPTAYRDAFSGILLAPGEQVPDFSGYRVDTQGIERRTVYRDPNMAVTSASDANDCMIQCAQIDSCMAFSFNSGNRSCQLKETANNPAGGSSWVSGSKRYFDFSARDVIEIRD